MEEVKGDGQMYKGAGQMIPVRYIRRWGCGFYEPVVTVGQCNNIKVQGTVSI